MLIDDAATTYWQARRNIGQTPARGQHFRLASGARRPGRIPGALAPRDSISLGQAYFTSMPAGEKSAARFALRDYCHFSPKRLCPTLVLTIPERCWTAPKASRLLTSLAPCHLIQSAENSEHYRFSNEHARPRHLPDCHALFNRAKVVATSPRAAGRRVSISPGRYLTALTDAASRRYWRRDVAIASLMSALHDSSPQYLFAGPAPP